MAPEERDLSDQAVRHVREHADEIVETIAGGIEPNVPNPVSYFMAGSPGAGKTEYSKRFLEDIPGNQGSQVARIDHDEIRLLIPGYDGTNAHVFQRAASLGVERLHDHVLKTGKNFVLDATMRDFDRAKENVERSLHRGRKVYVTYVYQDPLLAWEFTKAREAKEGRRITKDVFIEVFFGAKDTVNRIKAEFGDKVELWVIEKNYKNVEDERKWLNVDNMSHGSCNVRFGGSRNVRLR